MKRKVIGARQDHKGTITQVKIQGNEKFTPVATAILDRSGALVYYL